MLDILIKNAKIIDGTGAPWFRGNVGIKEDKIAYIGKDNLGSKRTIDAGDAVVAPGFIDIHCHSDFVYFSDPANLKKLAQGVTTEVNGNCGISAAPLSEKYRKEIADYAGTIQVSEDLECNWQTLGQYLEEIENLPLAINVATWVGQGTVRAAVMGFEDRAATNEEMAQMKTMLEESMDAGAFGISTGLSYPPGVYTSTGELVELCKHVAARGGIYCTHIRSESDQQLEALKEAIHIGVKAGLPVQIAHHKICGQANWGQSKDTLALIDRARSGGHDVTLDQYPYLAANTTLNALLPPWSQIGGVQSLLNRLKSEDVRMKIKHEINEDTSWENPVRSCGGWQSILIISAPKTPQYEGKTMLEAAQKANKEPGDLIFDIIIANKGKTAGCMFMMEEKDVKNIMRHPATMVASDGIPSPPGAKSHPRMAGAFARILGYYVRKENVLSLEKAVKKMTGMPARRLGLLQKGFVHLGFDADIVVFDPDMVNDCATYQEPLKPPTGINYVIVGGKTVLEHGELTGAHPGKVLRHKNKGASPKKPFVKY